MATLNTNIAFFETGSTTPIPNVFLPNLNPGDTTTVCSFRVYNGGVGSVTYDAPTMMRFTCMLSDLTFSGTENEKGAECVSELWIEARVDGGAWTACGGDPVSGGDYLALAVDAQYQQIDVRIVVPVGASTLGIFSVVPCVWWDVET